VFALAIRCVVFPQPFPVTTPAIEEQAATISEVLAGKRQLTRAQIGKLASYFHVSQPVFLAAAGNRKKHAKNSHKGQ
jgi:plasmid maintenance system antidote protein VapI